MGALLTESRPRNGVQAAIKNRKKSIKNFKKKINKEKKPSYPLEECDQGAQAEPAGFTFKKIPVPLFTLSTDRIFPN